MRHVSVWPFSSFSTLFPVVALQAGGVQLEGGALFFNPSPIEALK